MGKKFFSKFLGESAAKVKGDPSGDAERLGVKGKGLGLESEGAAPYGDGVPFDDPHGYQFSQGDLDRDLAAADEGADRYVNTGSPTENLVDFDQMAALRIQAEQTGMRIVELSKHPKAPHEIIRLLSSEQAKQLMAVPVYRDENGVLVVAIADPANPTISDDLRNIVDGEVETVIAPESEIKERIEQYYGMGDESLEDVIAKEDNLEDNHVGGGVMGQKAVDLSDVETNANAGPVIKLVNMLLMKAINERASDIHLEPFPNLLRLRYRVDGVLREIPSPPRHMMLGLVSRLKVMSNLDIAETRMPQDGRIKLTMEGREVDMRVSTAPTVHGEAIVMRVLDKSMMMIGIGQIGMTQEVQERFMRHVQKPNGIVLVTGPTGSGKTTTLYAAVNEVKDPGDKLITVEDPVEYELQGIVQVNINEAFGLTFARCLRAILRQDPDTVLVGEIRDVETAQIAVQASLTGHLVFSTLHTNSAAATVTRLIDMGIQPFMLTSSIIAVIGQRLIRTICQRCRVPYTPDEEELAEFGLTAADVRDQTFFHGEGCSDCGHTGYRGRLGLFELLEITDEMRELILDQGSTDEIQEMAQRNGMVTMRQDGWIKICLGMTTFEEVIRDTPRDMIGEAYTPEAEEGSGDAPGEPKPEPAKTVEATPETAKIDEQRKIEAPVTPKLDTSTMGVQGEYGAKVSAEVGDAEKTPSVSS